MVAHGLPCRTSVSRAECPVLELRLEGVRLGMQEVPQGTPGGKGSHAPMLCVEGEIAWANSSCQRGFLKLVLYVEVFYIFHMGGKASIYPF